MSDVKKIEVRTSQFDRKLLEQAYREIEAKKSAAKENKSGKGA